MRRGDSGAEGKGRLRRSASGTDRPSRLAAGLGEGGAKGALEGGSRGEEGEEDARHFDYSISRDDSVF